jgi:hypothetical protein
MKRSERMAALKAERNAKMEQRQARMTAKKAGSNKRAYDNPEIQEKAARVFRDAFKKDGGDFARRQRRKFLKDAQFKRDTEPKEVMDTKPNEVMDTKPKKIGGIPFKVMDTTDQDTIDDLREGRTSGSDYYKKGGKVHNLNSKGINMPQDRKTYDAEYAKMDALIKEKKDELKGLRTGYEKDKVYKEYLESYKKEENDPTNAGRKLYRFLDKVGDGIRKSPIGTLANKMGTGTFSKDDAAQMRARKEVKGYKSGGKVKKGYKKGCGVKKSYKSGGKVRGAGCVTKGVRPCKMR